MTIIRTPRPLLANVSAMFRRGDPTIEQRLCDAMFARAIGGRGGSPKPLWEKASLRCGRLGTFRSGALHEVATGLAVEAFAASFAGG